MLVSINTCRFHPEPRPNTTAACLSTCWGVGQCWACAHQPAPGSMNLGSACWEKKTPTLDQGLGLLDGLRLCRTDSGWDSGWVGGSLSAQQGAAGGRWAGSDSWALTHRCDASASPFVQCTRLVSMRMLCFGRTGGLAHCWSGPWWAAVASKHLAGWLALCARIGPQRLANSNSQQPTDPIPCGKDPPGTHARFLVVSVLSLALFALVLVVRWGASAISCCEGSTTYIWIG